MPGALAADPIAVADVLADPVRLHGLDRRALGDLGEELVASVLENQGWRIVARNHRCGRGELDIVALDGEDLVFVEVKTRRTRSAGHPIEAVTPAKYQRLRRLAGQFLTQVAVPHRGLRIDVVAVLFEDGSAPQIEHLTGEWP